MNVRFCTVIGLLLILSCSSARLGENAELVCVKTSPDACSGKGLAFDCQGECMVLVPKHLVLCEPVNIEIRSAKMGWKTAKEDLSSKAVDVALLSVNATHENNCKLKLPFGEGLAQALERSETGLLKWCEEDGATTQMPVTIRTTSPEYLYVTPTATSDRIGMGMSGSLLFIDNLVAGMVVEVNPDLNQGEVYRQDYLAKYVKNFVKPVCFMPDTNCIDSKPLLTSLALAYSTGALVCGIAGLHYQDKADGAARDIPQEITREREAAYGDYKRFQAKQWGCWWTAANLCVTSAPFWLDRLNKWPLIDKWVVVGALLGGSAAFATLGYVAGDNADTKWGELESKYPDLDEDRVQCWADYKKYSEVETWFYVNAAIDLVTIAGIVFWYDRCDENQPGFQTYLDSDRSIKLSLGPNEKDVVSGPGISLVLEKSF